MYAYDSILLNKAQDSLGWMLDYAVNDCGIKLDTYYRFFINSPYADRFGKGESKVLAGMSGIEIAMEVIASATGDDKLPEPSFPSYRSAEFWTGWALAYYQWQKNISFKRITDATPIESINLMYKKYHELDISQFVIEMDRRREEYLKTSALKRMRMYAGISQSTLAEETGIPVKTIQQYEQGQKDIRKANVDYMIRLSKALYCSIEDLL